MPFEKKSAPLSKLHVMIQSSLVATALIENWTDTSTLSASQLRDLEICRARVAGENLESIGASHGMTRERVRQICANVAPGLVKELRAAKKSANAQRTVDRARLLALFIVERPGVTPVELLQQLPELQSRDLLNLPKTVSKLILKNKTQRSFAQKYSDEYCLAAIRTASTFYFPLSHDDYANLVSVGEVQGPSVPLLTKRFGSWSAACRLAGVESRASHEQYKRNWSRDEMVQIFTRFLKSENIGASGADYDNWRGQQVTAVPSSAHLRNEFASWHVLTETALAQLRQSWE